MIVMRRFAAHITLLLILCIGFQPFAQAMGARCASAGKSPVAMHETAEHSAHAGHRMQDMAMHEGHEMADSVAAADRCHCGGHCAMPDCVGAAAAIATVTFPRSFVQPAATHVPHREASAPRAAHGLDLIRPPSST